jgi:glycosyltransferase involved in cell wall biosynthesis
MACGVPCVATDVGDSRDIVGALGMIVPPRDPQALAGGIELIFSRGARAAGERARARAVAHHSLEQMRARYVKLYESLAASP